MLAAEPLAVRQAEPLAVQQVARQVARQAVQRELRVLVRRVRAQQRQVPWLVVSQLRPLSLLRLQLPRLLQWLQPLKKSPQQRRQHRQHHRHNKTIRYAIIQGATLHPVCIIVLRGTFR